MSNQSVRQLVARLRGFPPPQPNTPYKGALIVEELRRRYRQSPDAFTPEEFDFLKSLSLPRGNAGSADSKTVGDFVELDGLRYFVSDDGTVTLNNVQVAETLAITVRQKAQPLIDARDEEITSRYELLKAASKARRAGQLLRAETLARRAMAQDPGSLFAVTTLSSILRAQHDPEGAIALTEPHKRCADAWLLTTRAAALQDVGRTADAASTIRYAWACADGKPSEELRMLYRRLSGQGD